jgi:hypothetical protein
MNHQTKQIDQTQGAVMSDIIPVKDSFLYVGMIDKFSDNSFYTQLSSPKSNEDYNRLDSLKGPFIKEGPAGIRSKIPFEVASKYFDLKGLNEINIFNSEGKVIASGKFLQIEHVMDLTTYFVAVFSVDNPDITDYRYCMTKSKIETTPIRFEEITDDGLKTKLVDLLQLKLCKFVDAHHYRIDRDQIFSTVSADTTSFITLSSADSIRILYRSKSNEYISKLAIIAKKINGEPILVTESGIPYSDFIWTNLLIFNGKEYIPQTDKKIKVL